MSIIFTSSLIEAMDASYTEGSFVRTLGFFTPGDGGAAVYRVEGNTSTPIADKAIQYTGFALYCSGGKFHLAPDATHPTRPVFELIPQGNTVYAEQFGVMPGNESHSESNRSALSCAAQYASSEGYILKFASKGTYYFTDGISLFDKLNIDGGGAILRLVGDSSGYTFFYTPGSVRNVSFKNISFVGRRTADNVFGDQFLWSRVENLTMKNVRLSNFFYGLRTYTIGIANDYDLPPIVNKNWLIEDCSITDVVMGLQVSEIDGLTIKNSVITSLYPNADEATLYPAEHGKHNIYMESNCINVRLNNVTMGNVTGDAIHKSYAVNQEHDNDTEEVKSYYRFDKSKNHFYTDISVYKCNSPLTIGFASENVMCDNVFATFLRYQVYLSAVSNCIIANSSLVANRPPIERYDKNGNQYYDNPNKGLYVRSACSCWFQNSYLYTNGNQRVGASDTEDVHYRLMNIKTSENNLANVEDKKHSRIYIGSDFSIPNHWFKFTGCDIVNDTQGMYYFADSFNMPQSVFHEYMDNCILIQKQISDYIRLKCINSMPYGITFRNCYLKNTKDGCASPIRFQCDWNNCDCMTEDNCPWKQIDKRFPFVHFENNILDNFGYAKADSQLRYHFNTYFGDDHNLTLEKCVNISGTYICNSHRLLNNKYVQLDTIMGKH